MSDRPSVRGLWPDRKEGEDIWDQALRLLAERDTALRERDEARRHLLQARQRNNQWAAECGDLEKVLANALREREQARMVARRYFRHIHDEELPDIEYTDLELFKYPWLKETS